MRTKALDMGGAFRCPSSTPREHEACAASPANRHPMFAGYSKAIERSQVMSSDLGVMTSERFDTVQTLPMREIVSPRTQTEPMSRLQAFRQAALFMFVVV